MTRCGLTECFTLRIDYGEDGAMHALVHLNLNSSALDYPN